MHIDEVKLCATVADHRVGPRDPLLQVAFAGRSNVGKSSLLNSLFGRDVALVSKTPGKTRTINYYLINRAIFFVDLPGYGYAKVAQSERRGWGERVTHYLQQEERLRVVVGLVDPRIPTSPLDVELVRFVREAGRRLLVVATKSDQLGRGALAAARQRLAADLGLEEKPLIFSARTGSGKRELLSAIAQAVAVAV
jgi:GTP-binding protein